MNSKVDEVTEMVLEISKKIKRKLSAELGDLVPDLSIKEINILDIVSTSKKTMGEIAIELQLTPGSITPLVDRLVKKKYLKRERDENEDRRKIFIKLDKKGEKIEQALLRQRFALSRAVLKNLDDNEQNKVLVLFKKILVNLEND